VCRRLELAAIKVFTYESSKSTCNIFRGTARNFVREGPVTDDDRVQSLAILHKDHFDVTARFLVFYNRIYVKYLLPVGIEQLQFVESTREKSEQVCFGGGLGLFGPNSGCAT